jgi:hypothetical protein
MRTLVPPLAEAEDVCAAARRMGWIVGTAEELVANLRDLEYVGVDRAILGHYDTADVAALELLADRVIPALR